jgi:hypothetical protein
MIDKLMKKYGYAKTEETEYGAYYKKNEPQNFEHIVCVIRKKSGRHIMQTYDAQVFKVDGDFFNISCGVEIPVLLLMWLKAKYLGAKYKWGKCNAK